MKTNTIKILALTLLCFLSMSAIKAQDVEGDEPSPGSSITPPPNLLNGFTNSVVTPIVKSSSVISYTDGLSLAIEFEQGAMVPQNAILVDKKNLSDTRTLNLNSGKVELFGIPSGRIYEIKAAGTDGQQYIVGTVNTTPYQAGSPVIVSEKLYRALSLYVTNENHRCASAEGQRVVQARRKLRHSS